MALTTIVPTILSKDSTIYKDSIKKYYAFAKRVHIDISDGSLTSSTTIPVSSVWWPKGWLVDIHLISAYPSKHLEALLKIHPNMVIFHAEAKENLIPIMKALRDAGMRVGVCIIKNVYPGSIKSILELSDHALIFSGKLGEYGGTADMLLLEKVALIQDVKPSIEVGWDGGATIENVHNLTHGGINVINCGSAIFNAEDPAQAYEILDHETENEAIF